ncbi:TonB-dependent receptor [Simiduia sp. 21SJ11W-1]|uniref:TonB-dependent receptor plug domain-containing protein n=1 Tax=Simiduia sp. 21SJ11W-1 TaxID=2909669 RepID=UPI00209CC135|nr:TonB-dependent receptor [Simiduia sp. 21SJ11W-1]UTA47902.1 TonB-dependent receptor [Simiduia sp. 21SJ11W-1]
MFRVVVCSAAVAAASLPCVADTEMGADELIDLPLEELMQMETTVSSVSKRDETLRDIPAAIYVVSKEDIRRSGVTTVPDALRMVPGVHVGKISSSEWAVSARGLGGRFSRYLLVLIDGRSIYTSLFSGVNWDEINLSLENIERIEVVRGPGGTIWGANAVNGMINIITRKPNASQGTRLRASAGSGELAGSFFAAKSTRLGESSDLTISGHIERFDAMASNGRFNDKPWQSRRLDVNWRQESGPHTVSVDMGYSQLANDAPWSRQQVHENDITAVYADETKRGYFLVGNWSLASDRGLWSARASYDSMDRDGNAYIWQTVNTDAEAQWAGSLIAGHQTTLGVALRYSQSDYKTPEAGMDSMLAKARENTTILSAYIQDTWQINDHWDLNAGLRYDDNSFTNAAVQPSLRTLWRINEAHSTWAGISRAVSTPSRILNSESYLTIDSLPPDGINPLPSLIILASDDQGVEDVKLNAFELGYRYIPDGAFSVDLTAFLHQYDNIMAGDANSVNSIEFENGMPYVAVQIGLNNNASQTSRGAEMALKYQINNQWFLQYSATYLNTEIDQPQSLIGPLLADVVAVPESQHSLRLMWNASSRFEANAWLRQSGAAKTAAADPYTLLDINLVYKISKQLNVSASARNLFAKDTSEYKREIFSVSEFELAPAYLIKLDWQLN